MNATDENKQKFEGDHPRNIPVCFTEDGRRMITIVIIQEMFENTKVIAKSCKYKDRQYNCQKDIIIYNTLHRND